HEEDDDEPRADLGLVAERDPEAARDGDDPRERHEEPGGRHALLRRIADVALGKVAEDGHQKDGGEQHPANDHEVAHEQSPFCPGHEVRASNGLRMCEIIPRHTSSRYPSETTA